MKRKPLITVLCAVLIFALAFSLQYFGVFQSLELTSYDALTQKEDSVDRDVYIIGIDDKTLEKYGALSTWSRDIYARLVEVLNSASGGKPSVIAFDMIYSDTKDAESDDRFAEYCKKGGNVITALNLSFKEEPEEDENGKIVYNPFHVDSVLKPYDSLASATASGFANTLVDGDDRVRRAMAWVDTEEGRVYSLALRAYMKDAANHGTDVSMGETYGLGNAYYFSYTGKPGAYNYVSFCDVLEGVADPNLFSDKVIFVGAYAAGLQDQYMVAISYGQPMYGVEIHANIYQALTEEKTQLPAEPWLKGLLSGLFCVLLFLIAARGNVLVSVISGVILGILQVFLSYLMNQSGKVMPFLLTEILLVLILATEIIRGYLGERARRRQVVGVFKQYVAPQIVEKISKDKDFKLVLGGENRNVAVLFVDIRGFTTMSESLSPEQVVCILNEYLSLTTKSIFDNGGTLDKFVGDATMAVFNAPFDLDDYIYRGVKTAWDMKKGADALMEKMEKTYGKTVGFGIGVNCGPAVVGNIGCDFRMDYTAIGDTVNTAARLESNAKRGQILISAQVYEAVKDRVEVTPIGEIPLKGKSNGVFVYQVDNVK